MRKCDHTLCSKALICLSNQISGVIFVWMPCYWMSMQYATNKILVEMPRSLFKLSHTQLHVCYLHCYTCYSQCWFSGLVHSSEIFYIMTGNLLITSNISKLLNGSCREESMFRGKEKTYIHYWVFLNGNLKFYIYPCLCKHLPIIFIYPFKSSSSYSLFLHSSNTPPRSRQVKNENNGHTTSLIWSPILPARPPLTTT